MKNVIVALVLAAALATGAPATIGWFLEHGAESRIDQLLDTASFLSVAEHRYKRGWFSSDETITFELFKGAIPATGSTAGLPAKGLRVTVHNTIHHGPVPAFAGIGLARIDTDFVAPSAAADSTLKPPSLAPLTIQTMLGFLGGQTTVIRHPVIKETTVAPGWSLAADAVDITIRRGRNGDSLDVDGSIPHVLVRGDSGVRVELTGLKGSQRSRRVLRSLFAGHGEWTLGDLEFYAPASEGGAASTSPNSTESGAGDAGAGAGAASLRAMQATFNSAESGGFVSSGAVITAKFARAADVNVQAFKLDVSVAHVQAESFERVITGMRRIQRSHSGSPTEQAKQSLDLWRNEGVGVATHDPAIRLALQFAMPEGFASVSSSVRLTGATDSDFKPTLNIGSVMRKVNADVDISIDEALLERLSQRKPGADSGNKRPPGMPDLKALEDQGFVVRDGGRLHSKLVFARGALSVNDRPFPGQARPDAAGRTPAPM